MRLKAQQIHQFEAVKAEMSKQIDILRQKDEKGFDQMRTRVYQNTTSFYKEQMNLIDAYQKEHIANLAQLNSNLFDQLKSGLEQLQKESPELLKIAEDHNSQEFVKLDVGGEPVSTTLQVLRKVKGSKLEKLMSENLALNTDICGKIIIDSNPIYFKQMIDFLKSDCDQDYLPDMSEKTLFNGTVKECQKWGILPPGTPEFLVNEKAKMLQSELESTPDLSSRQALDKWKMTGPLNFAFLAEKS